VSEEVRGENVAVRKRLRELREVASVARDPVQADGARRGRISPLVESEPHSASFASESGTISVRRSSRIFTSDQMTVPSLSMRKVPRCGAPFASLNTP